MSTVGTLVTNLTANTTAMEAGLKKGMDLAKSFKASVSSTLGTIGTVLGTSMSLESAKAQGGAEKKLKAALEATGNAAGLSAKEIIDYARQLEKTTNFSDQATISAAALLASFKQIGGQQFKDILKAGQDMSALFGTDLETSVTLLAKALADPEDGFTRLKRAGVVFTDEQEKTIKTMAKMGDAVGAQNLMLSTLKDKFGGVAESMASPVTQLKIQIGKIAEGIGAQILPFVKKLAQIAVPFFEKWGGVIIQVGAALLSAQMALRALAVAQAVVMAFSGPAGWAAIAVSIAAASAATWALNSAMGATAQSAGRAASATADLGEKIRIMQDARKGKLTLTDDLQAAMAQIRNFQKKLNEFRATKDLDIRAKLEVGAGAFAPKQSDTEKTIFEIRETLREIGRMGDVLTAETLAKLSKPFKDQLAALTGVTAALEKAEEETAKLGANYSEIEATLGKLAHAGALPEQLDAVRRAMEDLDKAKAMKSFADAMQDVRNQIADMASGLGDAAAKMREFKKAGIDQNSIDQFRAINRQLADMKAADALTKSVQTPAEKASEKMREINDLLQKGMITDEIASRARKQVMEGMQGSETHRTGPGIAMKDSAAAISSILAAGREKDAAKQIALAEDQLKAQQQIAANTQKGNDGGGQKLKVVTF